MKRVLLLILLLLPCSLRGQSVIATTAAGLSAGSWSGSIAGTLGWTNLMFFGNGSNSDMAYNMNGQWDSNRHIGRWWTAIHSTHNPGPCYAPIMVIACADETQVFNVYTDATNTASNQLDAVTGKYNSEYAGDVGGHAYNEQTMDDRGNSFRCWHGSGVCQRFDVGTQTWANIATNPGVAANQAYLAMSWNPDAQGLILITSNGPSGVIWFWRELTNTWTSLFASPTGVFTDGFSGLSLVTVYNPISHQMFLGGGADGSVRDHNFYLLSYTSSCGDATSLSCWSFNFNGVNGVHTMQASTNACGSATTAFVDSSGEVGNLAADPVSGKFIRLGVDNSCDNVLSYYDPTTDNGTAGSGWGTPSSTGVPSGLRMAGKPGAMGGGAGNYFVSVPVPEYGVLCYIQQTGASMFPQGEIYCYKPNAHPTGGSAPSVPASLSNSAKSATTAELRWTASSAGTNTLEGYKVYRDGLFVGYALQPIFNAIGLSANTTYAFTVTSYDNLNQESSASSSLNVTTDAQLYTFAQKCAIPGVLHCDGFDTDTVTNAFWPDPSHDSTQYFAGTSCSDIFGPMGTNPKTYNTNLNPSLGTPATMQAVFTAQQCLYPKVVTAGTVNSSPCMTSTHGPVHSGTGALLFCVPDHAATVSGEYYGVFKDHGAGSFGYVGPVASSLTNPLAVHEGNKLHMQWYQYIDTTMLTTVWDKAVGSFSSNGLNTGFWTTASAGATTVTAVSCTPNTGFLTTLATAAGSAGNTFVGQKMMFEYGTNFTPEVSFDIQSYTADNCGVVLSSSPTPSAAGNVMGELGFGEISTTIQIANGWKLMGVYGDPVTSLTQGTCCGPAAQVATSINQTGLYGTYVYGPTGSQNVYTEAGDWQNRPNCTDWVAYPDPDAIIYPEPTCLRMRPNQWQEITVIVDYTCGAYDDTMNPSTTTGCFDLYVDGQRTMHHTNYAGVWGPGAGSDGGDGFGQFNLSPYHTLSDSNINHADTYVVYDDLIVSTSPIPMLSTDVPVSCTPDHLAFTSQPSNALIGASLGSVTVAVKDSGGVTCGSDTSTITITKHAGTCTGMTLNGTVSGAASGGVFTTSNLDMTVATGSCSLDADDGILTGATSNSFTISSPPAGVGRGKKR